MRPAGLLTRVGGLMLMVVGTWRTDPAVIAAGAGMLGMAQVLDAAPRRDRKPLTAEGYEARAVALYVDGTLDYVPFCIAIDHIWAGGGIARDGRLITRDGRSVAEAALLKDAWFGCATGCAVPCGRERCPNAYLGDPDAPTGLAYAKGGMCKEPYELEFDDIQARIGGGPPPLPAFETTRIRE